MSCSFRLSQIYENVNVPSKNVYMDDGGDSESSQYMRDILQVEEQSRCNQLKNKAAQNNIGNYLTGIITHYLTIFYLYKKPLLVLKLYGLDTRQKQLLYF